MGPTDHSSRPFLSRLVLKDYKSIGTCDIELAPFTALVGPNGAGKSNILDSLRFIAESLRNSLEFAVRDRGGIDEVRRRSSGHPRHFAVRVDIGLPSGERSTYSFEIGSETAGGYGVTHEQCIVGIPGKRWSKFEVRNGELTESNLNLQARVEPDRLYLGAVSGTHEFRGVYDSLRRMNVYNINPNRVRELQDPDPSDILLRDGSNAASILKLLSKNSPEARARIEEYLEAVVPGVKGVSPKSLGPKETVEFRQDVGAKNPWKFYASSMSDGTLRALGVLLAVFQGKGGAYGRAPLVGIEEPESALHPAAATTLAEATIEASKGTQVIVTSHSPELLDLSEIGENNILGVVSENGTTQVARVIEGSRKALRQGLFTAGELLRMEQLMPCREDNGRQLPLFPRELT
ncbi:MAG: AAA family ATPase [Phycisphaerae bacterium]